MLIVKTKLFPMRNNNNEKIFDLTTAILHCTRGLSQFNKAGKKREEKKVYTQEKKKIQVFLFIGDKTTYRENSNKSRAKHLELIMT